MGLHLKRVLACVTAVSLMVVSLTDYSGGMVRQADAAERTVSTGQSVQNQAQTLEKNQKELRGATAEESSSAVVFSKDSGTYGEEFDLELTCGAGVASGTAIYFTTDGSDPSDQNNEARQLYTPGSIRIADREGDSNVLSAIDPNLFDAANVKISKDGKSFESKLEKPSNEDVDKCTVIKAAAQYIDGTCSEVTTNTYFIGTMADHIEGIRESCEAAGMDLSVMSISMDAEDLFDYDKGIYVKGKTFDQALAAYLEEKSEIESTEDCRGLDANYKQKGRDWERKTHIDYFESNGTETSCILQQDCGIRIQGNYSRSDYQKSFRLYARADYGKKNFKYAFWDQAKDDQGQIIDKYKKIVLRNGGNCAFTTKFSDAYWQSLMEGVDCDKQSARPCVVYLNGEYWGVYILQNDFCSDYFADKHGVDKDSVLVYKGDAEANTDLGYKLDEGDLPEGVTNEDYYFTDLENFLKEHKDVSDPADYAALCDLVDKDSALDYFATQVWINNKWDWPGKNWSMWKTSSIDSNNPYADGKWRFLFYDVEFGGISGEGDSYANTVKNSNLLAIGSAQKPADNWDKPNVRCFAMFMTNPEFREEFNARLTSFSDTMFEHDRMMERADQFKNIYQPILDQFFNRFPTLWGNKKRTADMAINGNGWDTYGTWANIVAFAEERAGYIPSITSWVDKQYSPSTPPTQKPTTAPTGTPIPTASPSPTGKPAPTVTPGGKDSNGPIRISLCDGAQKIVQLDANGKVLSTKYKVEGIIYTLQSNRTFAFSADNTKALKKKSSYVISDVVVAGGNKYKVTAVEAGAFRNLKKLKSVVIGENVKKIGKDAFRGCKKLKKISFLGKKVKEIGSKAFQGIAKKAKINCPKAKKKAYQKLIKKSGVNLKKTKIKITNLKQSAATKSAGSDRQADVQNRETVKTVTMSSLAKEDGSYNAATTGSVVTINSAEELKMLSEYTKAEKRTAGVTFKQTADIDGKDMLMEPIGIREYWMDYYEDDDEVWEDVDYYDTSFYGIYDGGSHSIRNLRISVKQSECDYYCLGMFGVIENAVLQNITLDSLRYVDGDTKEDFVTTDKMHLSMAAIAGCGRDSSCIENCQNHADLSATGDYVGVAGIIEDAANTEIKDCVNYGNLSAVGEEGDSYASGIRVWGWGPTTRIQNCANEGNIVSNGCATGIATSTSSGEGITNCKNTGKITGGRCAAGIVEYLNDEEAVVTKCSNSGEISANIAGGIVTYIYEASVVINCKNTGKIIGKESAGGIAGKMDEGQVNVTENHGEVTADQFAGGICGSAVDGDIVNVQNYGVVTADTAAGGIAGGAVYMNLGNLWNHGAISGTNYVGGIVGNSDLKSLYPEDYEAREKNHGSRMVNCIQLGTVSAGSTMGSIIAYSQYPDLITNCYCLEGASVPGHGSNNAITAETISAEQWKQQSFLDVLNQNSSKVDSMTLLAMQYDAQNTLQWSKQILFQLINKKDLKTDLRLKAVNGATGEEVAMTVVGNRYYLNNPVSGTQYDIYRILADGTEKQIDSVALQEEDSIYISVLDMQYVYFYLDGTWEKAEDEYGGSYTYSEGKDPYIALCYQEETELAFPKDPVKEGYEFGGWYSEAYAIDEESYAEYKEYMIQNYQDSVQDYIEWWENSDSLSEIYDSLESFLQEWLQDDYGYGTLEEFTENYDTYFDNRYKVTELYKMYEYDYGEPFYYVSSDKLYPKWIAKPQSGSDKKDPTPSNPTVSPTPNNSKVDVSKYQDKAGDYVQKKGLIYKVNRKKKTATVVGVNSKSITKATIVAKVKTGGKTYKVSAISKNAFKGCSGLKKITAKGKSLKKVKKKALKMIRKKKK